MRSRKGITLIALIITIIVLLILAGVSINAIVGDNGVMSQAQNAKVATEKAKILENLNMELTKYNIGSFVDENVQSREMIADLLNGDYIDGILASNGEYIQDANTGIGVPLFDESNNYTGQIQYPVKKDNYEMVIYAGKQGKYQAEYGEVSISNGGTVSSGTVMVTEDKFNNSAENENDKGKFEITGDASVMFVDEVSGELSISVKSGAHAKVNIFKNMTLTNAGLKRSAIDIANGGSLDIYIAEGVTVTVDSGVGSAADQNNAPGKGGYAGIHVPENSTLNIKGAGTLLSYGGNAGNAALFTDKGDGGGSGGGGAGAGIGGNGGSGGQGRSGVSESGKAGENCGNVNIYNTVTVRAFGGAGGAGANSKGQNASSGSGYPSAGIGGGGAGGAGGSCCSGGGGYQGGMQQPSNFYNNGEGGELTPGTNGLQKYYEIYNKNSTYWGICGGSYYSNGLPVTDTAHVNYSLPSTITNNDILSGFGGCGETLTHLAGTGGNAGTGGTIKISQNARIYAYNGSRLNDGTQTKTGADEAVIYGQLGIITKKYEWYMKNNIPALRLKSEQETMDLSGYINPEMIGKKVTINNQVTFLTNVDMSKQGIGSGAGYTEVSNGTYTVDEGLN